MISPPWLIIARKYVGLREIHGAPTAPVIAGWLAALGAWWKDDETPWCGTFVAACMQKAGVGLPKHWYRAKGWLDWGTPLSGPAVGAVVIFERDGGGHVGIVTGRSTAGNLLVLGGNQGDEVRESPFGFKRVLGYRWPLPAVFEPTVGTNTLPVYVTDSAVSEREA
jgi:uncharacterized protein (TIGR02594 family)